MGISTKIILGDCSEKLKEMADSTIDLIITSPPYADQRKNTYGGVHPDKYVEWFITPLGDGGATVRKETRDRT